MNQKVPRITTAIFDMDELMLDSAYWHNAVFEAVMKKYGRSFRGPNSPLTNEREVGLFGLSILDVFKLLVQWYDLEGKAKPEKMAQQFADLIVPFFEKSDIRPMAGLLPLIKDFQKHRFRFGLASSARKSKIDVVLKKFRLVDVFKYIVSGEDEIRHGKPAPKIFLKAAEKIGSKPSECIVLEDAKNGVKAAKAAGMYCIGVHNMNIYKRLGMMQDLSGADIQVHSLKELSVNKIIKLLK